MCFGEDISDKKKKKIQFLEKYVWPNSGSVMDHHFHGGMQQL